MTLPPMRRGILYMLAASLLFSAMAVLVKLLRGIPTQEIVFFRSALNVAFTLALMRRYRVSVLGARPAPLLLRGLFGYAALSMHFFALSRLPLADAVVIHNVSPLLVALLAPVMLDERGGARSFTLSAVGLAGVAVIMRPTGALDLAPGLAALGGALMSAFAYITIRSIGTREHPLTVALYFPLVAVFLSAAPALRAWVPPTLEQLALLLGVGLTTTAAQISLTVALQQERAAVATTVSYTSLVFTAVLAWVVFGEVPTTWTVGGTVLIVGAALWPTTEPHPPRTP